MRVLPVFSPVTLAHAGLGQVVGVGDPEEQVRTRQHRLAQGSDVVGAAAGRQLVQAKLDGGQVAVSGACQPPGKSGCAK